MKITKRQLRRIIKEEKAALLRESVTDMSEFETDVKRKSQEVSSKFWVMMDRLFDEDPEMFAGRSTREEWDRQVNRASSELKSAIAAAIEAAVVDVESKLHGGDYKDGSSHSGGRYYR